MLRERQRLIPSKKEKKIGFMLEEKRRGKSFLEGTCAKSDWEHFDRKAIQFALVPLSLLSHPFPCPDSETELVSPKYKLARYCPGFKERLLLIRAHNSKDVVELPLQESDCHIIKKIWLSFDLRRTLSRLTSEKPSVLDVSFKTLIKARRALFIEEERGASSAISPIALGGISVEVNGPGSTHSLIARFLQRVGASHCWWISSILLQKETCVEIFLKAFQRE
ncbi:hypothetical protein CEXT_779211 [Caerostris extrusa]|uniref:Uncharacterized protein n=1 Tax=Caerostris extrusa TaxID=172846 RepID=A0AAV4X204_CAEEX|nr:hypothetical protein CEXT_779211 [Caerostris extrusa]